MDRRALILQARELRRGMTPEEEKLWYRYLRWYPVKFRRQTVFDRFILDFYCPRVKLAIELDGTQHHLPGELEKDQERTQVLMGHGITVLRFDNALVRREFAAVCQAIDQAVEELLAARPARRWKGTPRRS